jgi:hypothetical protein
VYLCVNLFFFVSLPVGSLDVRIYVKRARGVHVPKTEREENCEGGGAGAGGLGTVPVQPCGHRAL